MQNALESALERIDAGATGLTAAGRTDTGVHATGQVISFTTTRDRPMDAWRRGLNSNLPGGVRITWAHQVVDGFNARFSATARRYLYVLFEGECEPLLNGRATSAPRLDDAAMHAAIQHLIGEHDFTSFRASACQSPTPWRRVDRALVHRHGPWVIIDVTANAFLLRMMRNITGALLRVGTGEWSPERVFDVLAARDRTKLGKTAPPDGLYLVEVSYPQGLIDARDTDSMRPVGESRLPAGQLPPMLAHLGKLDSL